MRAGRLAAATQLVFAALLGGLATLATEPGFIHRGVVLFGIFAMPAVVGFIGARERRSSLLAAAGLTSFVGAFIAFSGVTLIFLFPALLFLAGAVAVEFRGRDRHSIGASLVRLMAAIAVTVLIVGAGASALLVTDEGCWNAYETPTGIRIERLPYTTGEKTIPSGARSSGCSTGLMSLRGVAGGVALGGAALGLAWWSGRRRREAMPAATAT